MSEPDLDHLHYRAMLLVRLERRKQLRKWGVQKHPSGTGSALAAIFADQWKSICDMQNEQGKDDWATIAIEEVLEALAETDPDNLLTEVVQAAAVFVAWAEHLLDQQNIQQSNNIEERINP